MEATSLRRCIAELSSKSTDYKHPEQAINQAESLKSLSSDLYTDPIRFLIELIQNADDAHAKDVVLTILEDRYLIVAHNGEVFDDKDLQGLCGINNGTKRRDLEKTGYKGLGFKAVFGKSERVIVYSNGEYFRFDSSYKLPWSKDWGTDDQETWERENNRQFTYPWQINPLWTEVEDVPATVRAFLNSKQHDIHVANIILMNNLPELHLTLNQIKQQPYVFLFLRTISRLTIVKDQTTDILSIDHRYKDHFKRISLNEQIVSQWIIKRIELAVPKDIQEQLKDDCKVPEKLRSVKKAEVFFAGKYIDAAGRSGIERLSEHESILFSYLPTKISDYKLPILINANFLTNANREQIHTDSTWNQWLFSEIPRELFQWIGELVLKEKYRSQAYRLIPEKMSLTNDLLSAVFDQAIDKAIENCPFLINNDRKLLKVNEVIMDVTSISHDLPEMMSRPMRMYLMKCYEGSSFQCADQPFIADDPNLHRLNVKQFTWQRLIEMFQHSDLFLSSHSVEQNKQLIKYFHSKFSILPATNDIGITIDRIPFLLDRNHRFQLIENLSFPNEDTTDLSIHPLIFRWLNQHTEIKQWLEKLGLTESTDSTYFHKRILPNVTTYITPENAIQTVRRLFRSFQKNEIGRKHLEQLKELKLLTTSPGLYIPAEQCYFCNQYKPRLALEEYLKSHEKIFLSFDYADNQNEDRIAEWRQFFSILGVREELHLLKFPSKLSFSEAVQYGFHGNYLAKQSKGYFNTEAYSGLITIPFLQYTENDYEFAKLFWSYVIANIKSEELEQNIRIHWGQSHRPGAIIGTPINHSNYVEWFVKNRKCIPTTWENTLQISSDVFYNTKEMKDLCVNSMPFPSMSLLKEDTDWCHFFSFKTKLELNDCLSLLQKIASDPQPNLIGIQRIYAQVLTDIHLYGACERDLIKSQESVLRLLSEDNVWKLAKDLYFYVQSRETPNHVNDFLPCLKLDSKNRTHPQLVRFLELFTIQQIKEDDLQLVCTPTYRAEQLQRKLIEILPFIQEWLKKLHFPSVTVSSLDKLIRKEILFLESDCLQLLYNGSPVSDTNAYFNGAQKEFYVTRSWNSETTFMDLPHKLCQALGIQGFEDKIRFLFKAESMEITRQFRRLAIDLPIEKNSINFTTQLKPELPVATVLPIVKKDFIQSIPPPADMNHGCNDAVISPNGNHSFI